MKKITNLLYVLAVLMLVSCNDFLDKSPKYAVDPETTVTDDVAVALTNACYKALQSSNLYNQRMWSLDIVAGNSLVGAGGGTDGLETIQASNFITQSDNGMALYMWRSPWVGIGQCNIVLTSLPQAEAVSESIKNRCMGEAYFLRAHYYYILARLYGGVPLRLEPYNPGESTAIARTTLDQTYEQIISDCKNAVDLLPAKAEYNEEEKAFSYIDYAIKSAFRYNYVRIFADEGKLCAIILNIDKSETPCYSKKRTRAFLFMGRRPFCVFWQKTRSKRRSKRI